ncbi:hypothetical protein D3C84_888500 [compost metagenome]
MEDYDSGKFVLPAPLEQELVGGKRDKKLVTAIKRQFRISYQDLYIYLNDKYPEDVAKVCSVLKVFLNRVVPEAV